jgi:hypothetical protein
MRSPITCGISKILNNILKLSTKFKSRIYFEYFHIDFVVFVFQFFILLPVNSFLFSFHRVFRYFTFYFIVPYYASALLFLAYK